LPRKALPVKRPALWFLILGAILTSAGPARSNEWRVGAGAAPYYWGKPSGEGWGSGWIFSGQALVLLQKPWRPYARVSYAYKPNSFPGADTFHSTSAVVGMQVFYRPFYLGAGTGWMRQENLNHLMAEAVVGIEFRIPPNAYIRLDLWRPQETLTAQGPQSAGDARCVYLMYKF